MYSYIQAKLPINLKKYKKIIYFQSTKQIHIQYIQISQNKHQNIKQKQNTKIFSQSYPIIFNQNTLYKLQTLGSYTHRTEINGQQQYLPIKKLFNHIFGNGEMDCNWLKHNVFVVQNGKIVPRPSTPEKRKNYRYINYDPLNNPAPEDYFRETISRLQKQNNVLKSQIAQKTQEQNRRLSSGAPCGHLDLIQKYQGQISFLKEELRTKERQLIEKNEQLVSKDKRILEISNQNTKLHLRISSVVRQIQTLNRVMSKKDQQIINKKQQLQEYCRTLQRLTTKQKEQEKTMFSENYAMTPKIQQKCSQEEDEFYSLQNNSMYEHSIDRRYMTPQIQTLRQDDRNQYIYRTEQQKTIDQLKKFKNTSNNNVGENNSSSNGKAIINDFKNSLWVVQERQYNPYRK